MPSKPAPEMQTRGPFAYSGCVTLFCVAMLALAVLLLTTRADAQTATFVSKGDTALLIAKMPACTTACPDSILRTWVVGERRFARVVKPKSTDTVRFLRSKVPEVATLLYQPYKPTAKTVDVPALVITWTTARGEVMDAPRIPERDSIRAVAVMRTVSGKTSRIPTPMTWTIPNLPDRVVMRTGGGALKDTLWLVAKR